MYKDFLLKAVSELIAKSGSDKKIKSLMKKHINKLHFIPFEYRILGGILQSMNIQFGNFIEELMQILVKNSGFEVLNLSGSKNNKFAISKEIEARIDSYILNAQTNASFEVDREFGALQDEIINDKSQNLVFLKHDIDLLFKKDNQIIYAEIKYNDDHDTGKFIDINRKFIKTYAYLVRKFNIKTKQELKPILFYFNNKKMKGNIYLPEGENIYRGERFFDEFLNVKYDDLQKELLGFSQSRENLMKFDELYQNLRSKNESIN